MYHAIYRWILLFSTSTSYYSQLGDASVSSPYPLYVCNRPTYVIPYMKERNWRFGANDEIPFLGLIILLCDSYPTLLSLRLLGTSQIAREGKCIWFPWNWTKLDAPYCTPPKSTSLLAAPSRTQEIVYSFLHNHALDLEEHAISH